MLDGVAPNESKNDMSFDDSQESCFSGIVAGGDVTGDGPPCLGCLSCTEVVESIDRFSRAIEVCSGDPEKISGVVASDSTDTFFGDCETNFGDSNGEIALGLGESTRGCELNLVGVKGREDVVGLNECGVGEEDRPGVAVSNDCCFLPRLGDKGVVGRAGS